MKQIFGQHWRHQRTLAFPGPAASGGWAGESKVGVGRVRILAENLFHHPDELDGVV
jgi:hypothetical protein